MEKARFESELIQGHKGVAVVLVPFDPEEGWAQKPMRLDPRRHGWLVSGKANGIPFDGYIGERWNRFIIIIGNELRDAAEVSVGDTVRITVKPISSERAFIQARAQSRMTTAPKKHRTDAIASKRIANDRASVGEEGQRPDVSTEQETLIWPKQVTSLKHFYRLDTRSVEGGRMPCHLKCRAIAA